MLPTPYRSILKNTPKTGIEIKDVSSSAHLSYKYNRNSNADKAAQVCSHALYQITSELICRPRFSAHVLA